MRIILNGVYKLGANVMSFEIEGVEICDYFPIFRLPTVTFSGYSVNSNENS